MKRLLHNQSGVSIIELLVALGIFSIFIAMAVSGFVQAVSGQKLILLLMEANDSASLALEQMSREIRTAEPGQIETGPGSIKIEGPIGTVTYALSGDVITRNGYPITTSNGNISIARFETDRVRFGSGNDRVLVYITTEVRYKNLDPIQTNLQTSITPRIYYGN